MIVLVDARTGDRATYPTAEAAVGSGWLNGRAHVRLIRIDVAGNHPNPDGDHPMPQDPR